MKWTIFKFAQCRNNRVFSVTQILHGIKVGKFRGAKSAILSHSETVHFDLYEFLHFLKAKIYQINTIQSPKNGDNYILNLLSSQKLISLKNLSNRNKNVQRFLWPILAKLDNLAYFVWFEKTVYNFALYVLTTSSCEDSNSKAICLLSL